MREETGRTYKKVKAYLVEREIGIMLKKNLLLKEREVHAAIHPFFYKMWMCFESVLFAMLQNKQAVFFQQVVCEYQIRESF